MLVIYMVYIQRSRTSTILWPGQVLIPFLATSFFLFFPVHILTFQNSPFLYSFLLSFQFAYTSFTLFPLGTLLEFS